MLHSSMSAMFFLYLFPSCNSKQPLIWSKRICAWKRSRNWWAWIYHNCKLTMRTYLFGDTSQLSRARPSSSSTSLFQFAKGSRSSSSSSKKSVECSEENRFFIFLGFSFPCKRATHATRENKQNTHTKQLGHTKRGRNGRSRSNLTFHLLVSLCKALG
jgi:hypothetical protein